MEFGISLINLDSQELVNTVKSPEESGCLKLYFYNFNYLLQIGEIENENNCLVKSLIHFQLPTQPDMTYAFFCETNIYPYQPRQCQREEFEAFLQNTDVYLMI